MTASYQNQPPLYIDLETQARVNITQGVYRYSEDPWTRTIGFAAAIGDEAPEWFDVREEQPARSLVEAARLRRVLDHVQAGHEVIAHNANFDRTLWNATLAPWPTWTIEQTIDTMAESRSMGFPGGLEHAAPAAGIRARKDLEGRRIMLKLCKPKALRSCTVCNGDGVACLLEPAHPTYRKTCSACRGTGVIPVWHSDPEDYRLLGKYACQDLTTMRELHKRCLPLTPAERSYWILDQRINDLGIGFDTRSALKAAEVVELEVDRLNDEMRCVTKGAVPSGNAHLKLTAWFQSYCIPTEGCDKDDIEDILALEGLPAECREAALIRQSIAHAATAKIKKGLEQVCEDGRLRGLLSFFGAHTGRWTASGFQPQNLFKALMKYGLVEFWLELLRKVSPQEWVALAALHKNPLDIAADCLRSLLIAAPGHVFLANDYAAIEARALAYFAGQMDDLEVFATHGRIYEHAASRMFKVPIETIGNPSKERARGKEATLACGYGMGDAKFHSRCIANGVELTRAEAKATVRDWRDTHQPVTSWWSDLQNAAMMAVNNPGTAHWVQRNGAAVGYQVNGSFLLAALPSGSIIKYPYPEIHEKLAPWGEMVPNLTYMVWKNKKWVRDYTFGGKLAENNIQRLCRDKMASDMVKLWDLGFRTPFHTHDEDVLEVKIERLEEARVVSKTIMEQPPAWAPRWPIKVTSWSGERYRKE